MTDQIAGLVLSVDSSSAQKADADLNALANTGDKAAASATNLMETWRSMSFSKIVSAQNALAKFKEETIAAAAGAEQITSAWEGAAFSDAKLLSLNASLSKFRAEASAAAAAANSLDQEWKKGTWASGSGSQLMRANQGIARMRAELNAAAKATRDLSTAENQGAVSAAKLASSHHQVAKAQVGYVKSAKELAFATRNLPAQFTDIAVSLQAGQNPLTVLLQQGGQLKDMFGGVGPAFKAMGSYVLGLITPVNLLVAALGALAVAWVQGEAEGVRFNEALIKTGNAAGITRDQLVNMSEDMATSIHTQRAAAAALTEVASAGVFAARHYEMIAKAALEMSEATGQSINDTVKQFEELRTDPLDAVLELNRGMNFLTVETYNQIRALELQGDTLGAAELAMTTYADAVSERAEKIEQSLGTLETAWNSLARAAKAGWDAVLDIGRPETHTDKMRDLFDEIERAQAKLWMADIVPGAAGDMLRNKLNADLEALREEYARNMDGYVEEQRDANRRLSDRLAADAIIALQERADEFRTRTEKLAAEEAAVEEQARIARFNAEVAGGEELSARLIQIEDARQAALAGIRKKYEERPDRASREAERAARRQAAEFERLNESLSQHETILRAAGEAQDGLTSFERYALRTLSDLENGYTLLNEAQIAEIRTRIESIRVIDAENEARKRAQKMKEIDASITERLVEAEARRVADQDREIDRLGRGRSSGALMDAMDAVRERMMEARNDLAREYGEINAQNSEEYLAQLARINEAEARLLRAEEDHWRRRRSAMLDWRNGARAALEDIEEEMMDVAGQTYDSFMDTFRAMNRSLDEFARTGKFKMRDFANEVIAQLVRIAVQWAAMKMFGSLFGGPNTASTSQSGGGGWGGFFGSLLGGLGGGTGKSSAAPGTGVPAGLATGFGGLVAPVTTPSATGGKVGGEPARTPSQVLGSLNVTTNIHLHGDTTTSTREEEGENSRLGRQMSALLTKRVRETLVEETRQGGILWGMTNGAR